MSIHKWPVLLASFLLLFSLTGCALLGEGEEPQPTPTRTPKPTFTVTPAGQLANQHLWDADTNQTAATSEAAQALPTDTPTPIPTETPTPLPPTETPIPPTPTPVPPSVSITRASVNVRNGPGVAYNVVGSASNGQTFVITGKNPKGNWWQIDFNGKSAWIIDDLVEKQGQIDTVQVVASIPPAPTKPPPPPATSTPVPAPTQPPSKEFNIAIVQQCRRQEGGNWFEGTVYKGGTPVNGYRVAFSYAPDGPWVVDPQISGPHEGYNNWNPGYYSHIINAAGPKAGSWYVWIVNEGGARISEMANFQTTGPGKGCNEAVVDFDSR
ncbi:MAG: SH3 domain-containing protein [Chloroflexi bacterium]|nr:SH3 domain-containing protein [Chloroflexota bacterium]